VIGANTRLEIWDADAWQSYLGQQEDVFSAASEEVLQGFCKTDLFKTLSVSYCSMVRSQKQIGRRFFE